MSRALRTLQLRVHDLRLAPEREQHALIARVWGHIINFMGSRGRDGRLRRFLPAAPVHIITDMLTNIVEQPPQYMCFMLQFLGDYLGRLAEFEERRLGSARAKSFSPWLRQSLRSKPRVVHRWTKPRGWQLSQVDAALGPSSFPGDI
eukprot:6019885-Pyramimonas_sp.AAC.1